MNANLRIGLVARQVGVSVQTIRYYERRKLLVPAARTASGYRRYGNDDLQRLQFIQHAKALGFTLREIGDLLALRIDRSARCGDVKERAAAKLNEVERRIEHLEHLARVLRGLVRDCRAGRLTGECPILRALEARADLRDLTTKPLGRGGRR
ncbi:MAG: heavy metal-responsive transcriptional regulator [Nitrospirota bacterium]